MGCLCGFIASDFPIVSEHAFEHQIEIAVDFPVAVFPSKQQETNSKQKILLSKRIADP